MLSDSGSDSSEESEEYHPTNSRGLSKRRESEYPKHDEINSENKRISSIFFQELINFGVSTKDYPRDKPYVGEDGIRKTNERNRFLILKMLGIDPSSSNGLDLSCRIMTASLNLVREKLFNWYLFLYHNMEYADDQFLKNEQWKPLECYTMLSFSEPTRCGRCNHLTWNGIHCPKKFSGDRKIILACANCWNRKHCRRKDQSIDENSCLVCPVCLEIPPEKHELPVQRFLDNLKNCQHSKFVNRNNWFDISFKNAVSNRGTTRYII